MNTLTITQDDIDKGIAGKCSLCPVALAFAREFPGKYASTISRRTRLYDSKTHNLEKVFYHSYKLTRFIQQFDAQLPVTPGEYEYGN
jgi:hypothetical protein